jgi:hypothetical protein
VIPQLRRQTEPKTDAQEINARPRSCRPAPLSRIQAEMKCSSELGVGVATARRFCDVLTGADPKEGVLVTIPPHRGPVTISFELHNRHTYSAELVKLKQRIASTPPTVGVFDDGQHAGRSGCGAERIQGRKGFVRSH